MTGSYRWFLGVCLVGVTAAGSIWIFSDQPAVGLQPPVTAVDKAGVVQEEQPISRSQLLSQSAVAPAPMGSETLAVDPVAEPLDPAQLQIGDNPDYSTLDLRLAEMQARRDGQQFDPAKVMHAMQKAVAWQPDDSLADALPISDEERYDGRAFIRYEPLKVEALMPGDAMDIPLPQANATYRMQVDRVEAHGDGNVTWHGHLQDFQQENQVTITQSNGLTYAGITTPDTQYVLQVYGETGWIVSSGTLFKGEDVHVEVPGVASTAAGQGHDHRQHDHGGGEPPMR